MGSGKKALVAVVAVAVLGGGAYGAYRKYPQLLGGGVVAPDAIPTAEVRKGTFRRTISTVGVLQAAKAATVIAPVSGKLIRIVAEGSRVNKGDELFIIDTEDWQRNLDSTQGNLDLSEKDLEAAREEYKLTELKNQFDLRSEQTRVELAEQSAKDMAQKFAAEQTLVDRNISPKSKLEDARLAMIKADLDLRNARIALRKMEENVSSNLRIAQTKIERAELDVERNRKEVKRLQDRIASARVLAPSDGEVSFVVSWRNGAMSKPAEGDQLFDQQQVLQLPDTSEMIAIVPVHELDIATVEQGQPVDLGVEAYPGKVYRGEVLRRSVVPMGASAANMRRGGDPNTGPREFEVQVKLLDHDPNVRHGMTASARIITREVPNALMVPLESVVQRDGKRGVLKADRSFVALEFDGVNDLYAAVRGPIAEGDKVLLRDPERPLPDNVGAGDPPVAVAGTVDLSDVGKPAGGSGGERPRGRRGGNAEGGEAGAPAGAAPGGGEAPTGGEGRPRRGNRGGEGGGDGTSRTAPPAAVPEGRPAG